jgi:hypothetical protein
MLQLETDPDPVRFWTLTMPGGMRSPRYAFEKLPTLWDVLRKSMQRANGTWTYLAFVEGQAQRDGMPHFHILTYQPAPYRLKDYVAHLGYGYQAKDIPVQSKGAASYVSKYASKGDPAMPRGFRRVRVSRDWEKLPSVPHAPYICPSKGEDLSHYLIRVSEAVGISLDDVAGRWVAFDLQQIMY